MPEITDSSSTAVVLKEIYVNNPGGGDCAFYAFAIGLIDIIQREHASDKQDTFNRWLALAPSVSDLYPSICEFDMKHHNRPLLKKLQSILRHNLYDAQVIDLKTACVRSTKDNLYAPLTGRKVYNDFAALYYGIVEKMSMEFNLNPLHNLFAASQPLRGLIRKLPRSNPDTSPEKISEVYEKALNLIFIKNDLPGIEIIKNNEHLVLAPLLIRLIYGHKVTPDTLTAETPVNPDSYIIKLMKGVTQSHLHWGTLDDLAYLADVFSVNLRVYCNKEPRAFVPVPEYPTITINNEIIFGEKAINLKKGEILVEQGSGLHWTTKVWIAETEKPQEEPLAPQSTPDKKDPPEKESAPKPKKAAPKLSESKTDNSDQYKLTQLRHQVTTACLKYSNYSNSIWFSLFHRHWGAGKTRARLFKDGFAKIENYDEAKRELLRFLADNNDNGNKHPHSLRTMILHEVLESQYKISLQTTSAIFDYQLKRLKGQLNSDTSGFTLNL